MQSCISCAKALIDTLIIFKSQNVIFYVSELNAKLIKVKSWNIHLPFIIEEYISIYDLVMPDQ